MFEKLYRIAIVLLLVVIAGAQVVPFFAPPPPEVCTDALNRAAGAATAAEKYLDGALENYDTAAYTRADNINQQIFMAGEQSVMLQHVTALLLESLLRVEIACR
jgi:hypothetical protein